MILTILGIVDLDCGPFISALDGIPLNNYNYAVI